MLTSDSHIFTLISDLRLLNGSLFVPRSLRTQDS